MFTCALMRAAHDLGILAALHDSAHHKIFQAGCDLPICMQKLSAYRQISQAWQPQSLLIAF